MVVISQSFWKWAVVPMPTSGVEQMTVGTGPVSGATSNSYTIEGISYETMGVFTLSVTNSKVPGLTLTSRKQRVLATADLTFTALDLSNELFTEGEGYALRVTAPGKPYDTIQAVRGSAAGFVFEDLILGDYLIAVRADDLVEFLPTYYPSTDLWKEAEQYIRERMVWRPCEWLRYHHRYHRCQMEV